MNIIFDIWLDLILKIFFDSIYVFMFYCWIYFKFDLGFIVIYIFLDLILLLWILLDFCYFCKQNF